MLRSWCLVAFNWRGYWIEGLREFGVLCSWFLVSFVEVKEVGDEAADFGAGEVSLGVNLTELVLGNVAFVQCNVELALHLRSRSLRVAQELDKLSVAAAIESFGDIMHD